MLLTAAWTGSGAIIYLWAPLTAPALLLLSAVAPVAWCLATRLRLRWHRPSTATLALVLAGVYLTLNASWSLSPSTTHFAVAILGYPRPSRNCRIRDVATHSHLGMR